MTELQKVICALLVTSISSYFLGSFVMRRLKLQQKYQLFCLPFGFFFFVALFQLCIYPIQYFHLEAKYLLYVYQGLLVLSGIVGLFELKQILKINWKYLLVAAGLLSVSIWIYLRVNNLYFLVGGQEYGHLGVLDDLTFYARTVMTNAIPENPVGLLDVLNASVAEVNPIYAFTGILHFFSAQCMMWDVNGYYFTMWYGFIILRIIGFLMAYNVGKLMSNGNKWMMIFIICVMSFQLFTNNNIINGFEPVYLRGVPGSAAMLFISLIMYYRGEKAWSVVYVLFTMAALSCQSTQLFLSAILSVCIMVYEAAVLKKLHVPFLTWITLPTFIYLAFFLNVQYGLSWTLLGIIGTVLVVLNLIYLVLPKLFHYRLVYIVMLLAIAMIYAYPFVVENGLALLGAGLKHFGQYISLSRLTNVAVVSSGFDLVNEVLARMMLVIPFVSLVFWKELNKDMKFVVVFMLTTILVFYNPISMPFVSTYLTGIVYGRIENLVINQPFYFIMLSCVAVYFNAIVIACLVSAMSVVPQTVINTMGYIENFEEYEKVLDVEYKMDKQIIEISNIIDKYSKDKEDVKVLYPVYLLNLSLYNEDLVASSQMPTYGVHQIKNWLYLYDSLPESMKLQCYLYMPVDYFTDYYYEFENDRVPDIIKILRDTDADLVIFRKWNSPEKNNEKFYMYLSLTTKKIAEVGEYQIYEIIRE